MSRDLDAPWVFVDPGVHASGVAWFLDRALIEAEYRKTPIDTTTMVTRVDPTDRRIDVCGVSCVCEKPQVYTTGQARRSDLVDLAIAAGRMTGALPTEYITPAQWKGSAKKVPMHARMRIILSADEAYLLARSLDGVAKSLHHNVYDAVCMGLEWLGRWK